MEINVTGQEGIVESEICIEQVNQVIEDILSEQKDEIPQTFYKGINPQ
jgi:hypothetical protein